MVVAGAFRRYLERLHSQAYCVSALQYVKGGATVPGQPAARLPRPVAAPVVGVTVTEPRTDAVHSEPAWRDRSNFIIGARLPEEGRAEQLWARQVGDRQFEICCIPFFVYDVALGDVVETDASFDLVRVIEPSGRYVFRVWFGESSHPREEIAARLATLGALLEWSSVNLLAVDAADASHAQVIADFLAEQERCGRLTFETDRS